MPLAISLLAVMQPVITAISGQKFYPQMPSRYLKKMAFLTAKQDKAVLKKFYKEAARGQPQNPLPPLPAVNPISMLYYDAVVCYEKTFYSGRSVPSLSGIR